MGHWALGILHHAIEPLYALRQALTIEYQHRQQGNSGHGTVRFPYPKIIDRPIGCHDHPAIEGTARCPSSCQLNVKRTTDLLSDD